MSASVSSAADTVPPQKRYVVQGHDEYGSEWDNLETNDIAEALRTLKEYQKDRKALSADFDIYDRKTHRFIHGPDDAEPVQGPWADMPIIVELAANTVPPKPDAIDYDTRLIEEVDRRLEEYRTAPRDEKSFHGELLRDVKDLRDCLKSSRAALAAAEAEVELLRGALSEKGRLVRALAAELPEDVKQSIAMDYILDSARSSDGDGGAP